MNLAEAKRLVREKHLRISIDHDPARTRPWVIWNYRLLEIGCGETEAAAKWNSLAAVKQARIE